MKSAYEEILRIEQKREENMKALIECREKAAPNTAFIWTDEEFLAVDMTDIGELVSAMRFKAEHIRAKADPELFTAVADALKELFEVGMETYCCNNKECTENHNGRCAWKVNYKSCDDRW